MTNITSWYDDVDDAKQYKSLWAVVALVKRARGRESPAETD